MENKTLIIAGSNFSVQEVRILQKLLEEDFVVVTDDIIENEYNTKITVDEKLKTINELYSMADPVESDKPFIDKRKRFTDSRINYRKKGRR